MRTAGGCQASQRRYYTTSPNLSGTVCKLVQTRHLIGHFQQSGAASWFPRLLAERDRRKGDDNRSVEETIFYRTRHVVHPAASLWKATPRW